MDDRARQELRTMLTRISGRQPSEQELEQAVAASEYQARLIKELEQKQPRERVSEIVEAEIAELLKHLERGRSG